MYFCNMTQLKYNNVVIRQECEADFPGIRNVVKSAFSSAEHSDGDEHNLVDRLRTTKEYIPELSFVAVTDGKIVGHIMMSQIMIGQTIAVALAPLAVLPDYQRKGIGRRLIEASHDIARRLGYKCSVVLGSPLYYSLHGYVPASRFDIRAPFDIEEKYYMVYPLIGDILFSGTVRYSGAFGI